MNVAACISGQFRTLEHCFPSMVHYVIEPTNADVFLYTKECTIHQARKVTKIWPKVIIEIGRDIEYRSSDYPAADKKGTKSGKGRHGRGTLKNLLAQTHTIKAGNDMRNLHEQETGTQYDIAMRLRTDLLFFTGIPEPNWYDPSQLYTPNWANLDGTNDRFAIAGPDVMDEYAAWYDNIVTRAKYSGLRDWFHAEHTLQHYIATSGISMSYVDVKFGLCREPGKVKMHGCPPIGRKHASRSLHLRKN